MDQSTILIASFDIASPWDITGAPFMVENSCSETETQGDVSRRLLCGNEIKGYAAKAEGRRDLEELLNEEYLRAVPGAQCPEQESRTKQVEVPWGRPGTGCTLMFEALVLALVRQMSLKKAAAVFAKCDPRLWHLIDYQGSCQETSGGSEADSASIDETSDRKGAEYLNLFYDVEGSLDAPIEDGAAAQAFAEALKVNPKVANLGAVSAELSKAFILAVIEALLKASLAPERFQDVGNRKGALGKVSAQEGMLYPSQSRAPPNNAQNPGAFQCREEAPQHPRQPTHFFATLAATT